MALILHIPAVAQGVVPSGQNARHGGGAHLKRFDSPRGERNTEEQAAIGIPSPIRAII